MFYMVTVDLLRNFLLMQDMAHESNEISHAIAKLHDAGLLQEIGVIAIELIDDYFREGSEDCLFDEPGFRKTREIRAFLMSEKLGRDEQHSPGLRTLLNYARRDFRRSAVAAQIKVALVDD
jgi:hypothetical protein